MAAPVSVPNSALSGPVPAALLAGVLVVAACSALTVRPAGAQQQGYGQTLQGPGAAGGGASSLGPSMGKGSSVLDSVNPIDLMNKIRRSTALDDATPPSDAIDQALKEYSTQAGPAAATPAQTVKAP
ncbi:MAG: hypothetical protein RLZZ336_920 [Cyanobacteriota bacterium]|jgi:hypothetical protein